MDIKVRDVSDIMVIDISGAIDIKSSEIIEVVGLLIKNKKKHIILNCEEVTMIDYSGISILAIAYKNIVNNKGKMKLCNISNRTEELLRIMRLDAVFEIYPDENSAIKSFESGPSLENALLRRRFKRLDINMDAEFYDQNDLKMTWHDGKILNISGDGLFIYTKNTVRPGKRVNVKIRVQNKGVIELSGLVIWNADKKIQIQSYPGMGVYFNDLRKADQDKLLDFINKHVTGRSSDT